MCLLIHKPKHVEVPALLLESAALFNPHGYGFISFQPDGNLIVKRNPVTSSVELQALHDEFRAQECIIHLRYGTSGLVDDENTHPIRITDDIYLAHNGTLNMQRHREERSDTWHLVNDYLQPVLQNRPELLHDRFFHSMVKSWCGPNNRFVFVDAATQQTVIINREQGFEIDGLWLSNTRWFDASRFAWHPARATATERGPHATFAV